MVKNENKTFIFDRAREINIRYVVRNLCLYSMSFIYKILLKLLHPQAVKKKHEVAVCAIFKDESIYLREWIEYHLLIGIQHFYLYNNFSTDNYLQILEPYIKKDVVTLTDWPFEQAQLLAYKDCVKKYANESTWIAFIDLDEFIVPVDCTNIRIFLNKFKNRPVVLLYWKVFGSGGKITRDISNLVIEDFITCWPKYDEVGKCFFNTNYNFIPDYKLNAIFNHYMWGEYHGFKLPPVNAHDKVCMRKDTNSQSISDFPVQINHYFTKSFEEYKHKIQRGDAYFKINPRDKDYFFRHDMLCSSTNHYIFKYITKLKLILNQEQ